MGSCKFFQLHFASHDLVLSDAILNAASSSTTPTLNDLVSLTNTQWCLYIINLNNSGYYYFKNSTLILTVECLCIGTLLKVFF